MCLHPVVPWVWKGGDPPGTSCLGGSEHRAAGSLGCRGVQPAPAQGNALKEGVKQEGGWLPAGPWFPKKNPSRQPLPALTSLAPAPGAEHRICGEILAMAMPPALISSKYNPPHLGAWAGAPAAGPGRAEGYCVSKGLSRLLIRWWKKHLGLPLTWGAPGQQVGEGPTTPALGPSA